jgi:hypothetical protein
MKLFCVSKKNKYLVVLPHVNKFSFDRLTKKLKIISKSF